MNRPPSMQDLASRLKVHPSTISRALRNDPAISEGMRAKIQKAARDLNYRPNPLIAALVRSRRARHSSSYKANLGYLFSAPADRIASRRKEYEEMFLGAKTRANMLGYGVEEFDISGTELSRQRFTQILLARNIQGLILPPLYSIDDRLPVEWEHFGIIAIGLSHRIPANRVVHNHFAAMRTALSACRERGHKRIGVVLSRRLHEKVEGLWLASYIFDQFEQKRRGVELSPLLLEDGERFPDFDAWLRRHCPDAIVGLLNLTPLRTWLEAIGRERDVDLVTLDYHKSDRGFAGVFHNYARIGATAVDQLVGQLERNERGLPESPMSTVIDGVWIDRRDT